MLQPKQFPSIAEADAGIVVHDRAPRDIAFKRPRADKLVELPHSVPVHTTQETYNPETVNHFLANPPDPRQRVDDAPNVPQLFHHRGEYWVGEGHHRLIAGRQREGTSSTLVSVHEV